VADSPWFNLVVGDSSALIALASCRALSFLDKLAASIKVPDRVFAEVVVEGKPQSQLLSAFLEGRAETARVEEFVIEAGSLGGGELEAMVLFKQLKADVLLIDDARARKIACLNQIPIIGSLGILLLAKERVLIQDISPLIEVLRQSDLFISEELLIRTLELAGESAVPRRKV
jgi:hypothetical protein